ncbi:hypothetical protein ACQP2K_18265 [Microbispora siamensis]
MRRRPSTSTSSTVKAAYPALRVGTQREMWKDTTVYAFSWRVDSTGAEAITAVSSSWNTQTRTIPLRAESSIPVGTVLTNLMDTSDTVTVASGGVTGKQITVTLGEHGAKVYAPGTPVSSYTPPTRNITKIRVHSGVASGNTLSIRGDTAPFSWTAGRDAREVSSGVWEYELERIPAGQTFQFKPLVNDTY